MTFWAHFSFSTSETDYKRKDTPAHSNRELPGDWTYIQTWILCLQKETLLHSLSRPEKNQKHAWEVKWHPPGEGTEDFRFASGRETLWLSWELLRDQVTLHWAGGIQHSGLPGPRPIHHSLLNHFPDPHRTLLPDRLYIVSVSELRVHFSPIYGPALPLGKALTMFLPLRLIHPRLEASALSFPMGGPT